MVSGTRLIPGVMLVMGVVLGFSIPVAAQQVQVMKKIPYAAQSGASNKVKEQCALDTKVPEILASVIPDLKVVDGFGGGRKLELLIRDVHAPPAGAFSGPKWVTLHGTLKSGGKELGSFRAKRLTVFGAGTCGMLYTCLNAIADDVGEWLKSPTADARLGDAN